MRGGIYPDDLLLFPLQLDELPSTRAELLYHVCTTTKQPPRGCCWCSVLPSTESLVSSDLSWKITPNDQDAGGACLLLLSYRLYVLLQICCTKHLKLSGVPGFQLWTIHIHISLHVEWIVSTSCNLVLVGKGKWNNANDGRKIERLTYPTILHYTDSLIQIIIFASTLLVLTFLNSTWDRSQTMARQWLWGPYKRVQMMSWAKSTIFGITTLDHQIYCCTFHIV